MEPEISAVSSSWKRLDAQIWRLLWTWAMRRHPNKGPSWVRQKYFHAEGTKTGYLRANQSRRCSSTTAAFSRNDDSNSSARQNTRFGQSL
ncbi:group II intron maturase-specific domain-containing protein [Yersinia sp. J1]|uniref:group II intron maturase-specific domain-containing protein n=1 Tax=Yersinia sp. J1 TaxID=3424774 RepID=UPI003D35F8B8